MARCPGVAVELESSTRSAATVSDIAWCFNLGNVLERQNRHHGQSGIAERAESAQTDGDCRVYPGNVQLSRRPPGRLIASTGTEHNTNALVEGIRSTLGAEAFNRIKNVTPNARSSRSSAAAGRPVCA